MSIEFEARFRSARLKWKKIEFLEVYFIKCCVDRKPKYKGSLGNCVMVEDFKD